MLKKIVTLIKKLARIFLNVTLIIIITFILFELAYRNSIIDFYKPELKHLNSDKDLNARNIDFLVFGDSFSVPKNNYVDRLRKKHKDRVFINSSVPGIGLNEVNIISKKRINTFKPKTIIY